MTGGDAGKSDAALVSEALAGGKGAFTALVRRHQEPIYRFVRRYVGDADEAYDLVQETFVAAWEALARFDSAHSAGGWLRRIALNKCRDWSRRRAVRHFFYRARDIDAPATNVASETTDQTAALGERERVLARLDAAIAALPASLKEPLILTVFDGLSQQAAAAILGITAKAVETRIYRARQILGRTLND